MHDLHIALFPHPHTPHIYQFLGLFPELLRRGHRVTLVSYEAHAKLVVSACGEPVIFEPCRIWPVTSATNGLPADDPRCWEEVGSVLYPWLLNSAVIAARQVDKFYRENRPDLIIYEHAAYAGRILAKRLHVPVIQFYPDFVHNSGYTYWANGVGHNPKSMVEFSKLLDSFLWACGFEGENNLWHIEDLNFYQIPRELQVHPESIDSHRFCFVGPFLDRPFSRVWMNRSGGRRIILVSAITGSNDTNLFNMIIDALMGSEYHVILSVGEQFPTDQLRTLPPNFEINTRASHLEILPHTDLHLYSGGAGGTAEGLYFGVPLIALPSFVGNYQRANRLAELGVAVNLCLGTLTSQLIRDNIERVLQDEVFLTRVKQMRQLARSSGGSAAAVDRIEDFIAEHA